MGDISGPGATGNFSRMYRLNRVFHLGIPLRRGSTVWFCDVLSELSRSFARLYAKEGRPSVPPEQLLSTLLIQARCMGIQRWSGTVDGATEL